MAIIRVRLDEQHQKAIDQLLKPDGSYGYRNTSEIVRLAIERLAHAQTDRVSRPQRDAILQQMADDMEQLKAMSQGIKVAVDELRTTLY